MADMIDTPSMIEWYYKDEETGLQQIKQKTETHMVGNDGLILLNEHPSQQLRVKLDNNVNLSEVSNIDEVDVNTFYVDYDADIVHLSISRAKEVFEVSYYSTGCTLLSASRVYYKDGLGAVKNLQEILVNGQNAIDVNTEYATAQDLINAIQTTCNNSLNSLNTKITECESRMETKITEMNNIVSDCVITMFAGRLNSDLLSIKTNGSFINKGTCFTASTNLTFTAPYDGIYEFDGRCTSLTLGDLTISAKIGTQYLINIIGGNQFIGETIRFNNTLMSLSAGQSVTINEISSNMVDSVDNVHFTIKYLADLDRTVSDCVRPMFAGRLNNDLLSIKNGYINKRSCVLDTTNSGVSNITFKVLYDGTYEFDGRCTSTSLRSDFSLRIGIGTELTTSNYSYLVNIISEDKFIGETIRFDCPIMKLTAGTKIKIMPITENMEIDNVHFTIKFLGNNNDLV